VKKTEILRKLTALKQENEANAYLLEVVKRSCAENSGLRALKRQKECKIVTARPRLVCLENLLVNRYLDAEQSFYEYAHQYFGYATAFSEQLATWHQSSSVTEEWLSEHSAFLKPFIDTFNALIETESNRAISTL
jgi:hypothetical protein